MCDFFPFAFFSIALGAKCYKTTVSSWNYFFLLFLVQQTCDRLVLLPRPEVISVLLSLFHGHEVSVNGGLDRLATPGGSFCFSFARVLAPFILSFAASLAGGVVGGRAGPRSNVLAPVLPSAFDERGGSGSVVGTFILVLFLLCPPLWLTLFTKHLQLVDLVHPSAIEMTLLVHERIGAKLYSDAAKGAG